MKYQFIWFLLFTLPSMLSAMQIHPVGAQPATKKRWCSCICLSQQQAEFDVHEHDADLKRQEDERAQLQEKTKEAKRKKLLSAKSGDLRAGYALTRQARDRRATGHTSDPEHIQQFKKAQQIFTAEESAQKVVAASVRAVTPLAGALVLPLAIDPQAVSARESTVTGSPTE